MQDYVDAILCRAGLGDYLFDTACTCCGILYAAPEVHESYESEDESEHNGERDTKERVRVFRCDQCGDYLQCKKCVVTRHQLNPLHKIREWNGHCWTEACLSGEGGLGLVYQVGHHGFPCEWPDKLRSVVVMDLSGIHILDYRFCACGKASHTPMEGVGQFLANAWYPATTATPETCATFQALEFFPAAKHPLRLSKVPVSLFFWLFGRTDSRRLFCTQDREKVFGRMARQYAFILRLIRAGRGHAMNGVATTKPGELAVLCWPCPHNGKNLPEGWRDVDPKYRFLYMLLLAMDTNFRLKNRLRANEHQDPSLGSGLGYFVESSGYKTHLKDYVAEKDVSTCIAFAALLQKETRMTSGLRVSGVGGCVCARHGVVRPQGLGDLQKGEQYANMDYVLLSALMGVAVLCITISYDIACQWKVNLPKRAKVINDKTSVKTNLDDFDIQYALPVWHAAAHEVSCQTQNSLSYKVGVGRTDGEGIERTWAILNPLGFSTKEMGDGARHDAIENKRTIYAIGDTLARKLIVAIAERDKQVSSFQEVDSTLHKTFRKTWQKRINDWVADDTQPCPYTMDACQRHQGNSVCFHEGRVAARGGTVSVQWFFDVSKADDECRQRIKAEIKGTTLVTADRASQIQELRISFLKKLRTFERLQGVYMPGVALLKEAAEAARDPDVAAPKAEDIKLWLPSELKLGERRAACRRGLADVEAKLRKGQCADALDTLRSRLHAQSHLTTWRNSNSVGQRAATRSATLIGRVGDRISRAATKYRRAREALIVLKGAEHAPQFKELRPADINVNQQEEDDARARRKLARLGSSRRARNEPSNKPKAFSWIWTAGTVPGEECQMLHDSIRVEWSKALARRDRWVEEVTS
ncbi:hypothetical protein C8R43DRAFT_909756 [Mycena crocata]|nr:hypothetical protein C8R43DRAFT_909756 [Mycena crocata]